MSRNTSSGATTTSASSFGGLLRICPAQWTDTQRRPVSIEAVDEVSKTFKNTYSITHVLWMLFGALGIAGIAGVLTLELAQTRVRAARDELNRLPVVLTASRLTCTTPQAWQRQTTQTGRDDRNPARADRIYIGLRNCSFLVVCVGSPAPQSLKLTADLPAPRSISIISFILFLTENKACVDVGRVRRAPLSDVC
jgi:hypothetical protein